MISNTQHFLYVFLSFNICSLPNIFLYFFSNQNWKYSEICGIFMTKGAITEFQDWRLVWSGNTHCVNLACFYRPSFLFWGKCWCLYVEKIPTILIMFWNIHQHQPSDQLNIMRGKMHVASIIIMSFYNCGT